MFAMGNDTRCAVEGCDRNSRSRGWCPMHYGRWRKYGDPTIIQRQPRPVDAKCSIPECEGEFYGRGWCNMHYNRWRNHGDPLTNLLPNRVKGATLEERFWSKVKKTDTCWVWIARVGTHGYGEFNIDGVARLAHRVSSVFDHRTWRS